MFNFVAAFGTDALICWMAFASLAIQKRSRLTGQSNVFKLRALLISKNKVLTLGDTLYERSHSRQALARPF